MPQACTLTMFTQCNPPTVSPAVFSLKTLSLGLVLFPAVRGQMTTVCNYLGVMVKKYEVRSLSHKPLNH